MMSGIRSGLQSRLAPRDDSGCCLRMPIGIATLADEHILEPVNGVYFGEFSADAVLIKYADLCDGSLHLITRAAEYTDDFYVTAGSFSGWHAADACPLTRDIGVAGGGLTWQGGEKMKKILLLGALVGILLALGPPGMAAKYTFDLSKGPVSFSYTTIGAYNPIEITIVGENGVAQTWLASDYYQSQTLLEAMNELLMRQHGAVPWLDLSVESLTGKLSFQASTQDDKRDGRGYERK